MSYTNKLATLCTVASLFLWCGCTDDSDPSGGIDGGDAYITFGTQIGSVAAATRAVDQSWSAGDEVGVFMTLDNYDVVDDATNKLYTAEEKGDAWRLVASDDDNKLYYPSVGSVRFIAYYPYKENISFTDDASATYKVVLDEQTKSPEFDLLWYKDESIDGLFNKESAASLQFEHQLCKIVVNVSTKGFSADDLTVGITNVPTTADFNIKTGVLSNIGDKDDVTLAAVTTNADGENPDEEEGPSDITVSLTYQGILVPHDAGGDYVSRNLTFAFTDPITGEDVEFTHLLKETGDEAHHFKQNTISTYTVTLTRKEVIFDNVTIINWGDGNKEDIDFGNPELKIEPEANCYILKPGGNEVYIPMSRIQNYAQFDPEYPELTTYDEIQVGVLWSDGAYLDDVDYVIHPESVISDIYALGCGATGAICVKSGKKEGNTVVFLKKRIGDEWQILWSWHVWVTNYDPFIDDNPLNNNGFTFMGRNLGAITGKKGAPGSTGLYYQWGRKDPFPGSASAITAVEPTVYYYDHISGQYEAKNSLLLKPGVIGLISVSTSLSEPEYFYNGSGDWSSDLSFAQNDSEVRRWNNTDGKKAIDDPCPYHWKIPATDSGEQSPWYGLYENSNFLWDSSNNGATIGFNSWWPAAGYRDEYRNGIIRLLGEVGGVYTAATEIYGYGAGPRSNVSKDGLVTTSNVRTSGCNIRCVKEESTIFRVK